MRVYPALRVSVRQPPADFMDLVAAALDDFGIIAIEEVDGGAVRAFLSDARQRENASDAVRRWLPGAIVTSHDVPDEDWAERSQASLRAIRAGGVTVAPPWDARPGDGSVVITILPSMGFGTGHHATTRLCLEALQRAPVAGAAMLDVGTGSGVLAITAAKLSARQVVAIDSDPDAVANAAENAALNHVEIDLRTVPLEAFAAGDRFDIVTANLTGATLVGAAARLETVAALGGTVIVSGLREDEERAVASAFRQSSQIGRASDDGWVCLVMRLTQA